MNLAASQAAATPQPASAPPARPALCDADVAWVKRLLWGTLGMAAAVPLYMAGETAAWWGGPDWWHTLFLQQNLHLLAAAGIAVGTWAATTAEPGADEALRERVMRLSTRIGAILLAFMWLLMALKWRAAAIPCALLIALQAALSGNYLAVLARRLPHPELAHQFQKLMWMVPVAMAGLLLYHWYELQSFFAWFFFLGLPLAGALIGIGGWVMVMLGRLTWSLGVAVRN